MIQNYIQKLIENVPPRKKPLHIKLILGGGAFNGSYILGALYFLKELERIQYVKIDKISTCSISSILGLLYLTDNLDQASELYAQVSMDMKQRNNLSKLYELKTMLQPHPDICSALHKKLYICYNHIQQCKKKVVCNYKSVDHLFEVITRSCFIPFMIDYNLTYKRKYIDGILPHFFKTSSCVDKKTLYLDVCTRDKLHYAINIKNEKNNMHRLFEGALDIHTFFVKEHNTIMCSNVQTWSLKQHFLYTVYKIIEFILVRFIYLIVRFQNIIEPRYFTECIVKYILMCNANG